MVVLNERLGVALSWPDVLIPLSLLGFAFERNADSTVTVWILAPLVRAQICHASFKHTYIWRVDRCFAGQPECLVPTHSRFRRQRIWSWCCSPVLLGFNKHPANGESPFGVYWQ